MPVRFRRAQPDSRPGDASRGQAAGANTTDAVAGRQYETAEAAAMFVSMRVDR